MPVPCVFLFQCRILFIHADGLLSLWDIKESQSIFTAGRTTTQLSSQETKEVISACWACPFGSKVAVGYSTGDIHIYSIPSNSELGNDSSMSKDSYKSQIGHISKLNLGYRVEKVPIASLKWVYSDGKLSRLYAMGASDATPANLVQVSRYDADHDFDFCMASTLDVFWCFAVSNLRNSSYPSNSLCNLQHMVEEGVKYSSNQAWLAFYIAPSQK